MQRLKQPGQVNTAEDLQLWQLKYENWPKEANKLLMKLRDLSRNSLKITEDSRQLLDALVPEIQKTSQLVQEIASASIEQNAGADQINSAIQQLNLVTQQNAASSEEMATSAEELSSQADSLKSAVSFFKLDDDKYVI